VRVPVGPVAAPIAVGPGDGSWTVTGATLLSDRADTVWLGVQVTILSVWTWVETPGTWAERPGTWAAHGYTVDVDALTLDAPPTGLTRDVLVFSGRVTDLSASTPTPGGYQVEVIAVDQLAELANREVGDVPWTAETFTARVSRILTAAALDVDVIVDAGPIGGLTVSKRDVDSQPAANLLSEMAAGVDAVMWTAVHETLGGYLWFEDPATRAILSTLTEVGGVVVIVPAAPNRAPGRSVIDACQIPAGDVTWIRDVADVITRVDATWLDQTTTPPTERNTRVEDTAGIDLFGVRRYSLTTPLTTAVDADDTAARVLARSRQLDWRAEGVVWDVAMFPPAPGDPTAAVLDLLDGTVRIGRGIIIDGADTWPGIPAAATATGYLDGGRYLHGPAGWELGLYTTPAGGLGRSGPWTSLDPTWTWLMMDPDIAWSDLYGVTGPNVIVKGP
jgi:hypothetical protein